MINNKGYNFASDYWSHNVYQQAKNAISAQDGIPYGKKGDENWQYIALSEGWANYRQWKMSKQYLKYNSITKVNDSNLKAYYKSPADKADYLRYRYGGLMTDLNYFINDNVFEKIISTSSTINGFKSQLLDLYPKYAEIINKKFIYYEEIN